MKGRTPSNKGVPISKERRDKLSKEWIITYPDGSEKTILNLAEFCRINNLTCENMRKVAMGERKSCKGFKCRI